MFILHSSNKTENLVEHLAIVLKSSPLSSPLAKEVFLIQSQGMERWISQQLANHFKVWANFHYLFPAAFFDQISASINENNYPIQFDRHILLWRVEAILRNIDTEIFIPLKRYLTGDQDQVELKRFQLAKQLSLMFDQYQILRLELLEAWAKGEYCYADANEAWQCEIWQQLCANSTQLHRGEIWRQNIQYLQQAKIDFTQLLPERISVFGINTLPPVFLAYLQALSKHCDVHLYLLNPVQSYWADLPTKYLQAKLAEFSGHPLLVALGRQGREFQQLLLEQAEFHFEPSSFSNYAGTSNLHCLQNDILANQIQSITLNADDSISIHACHTRLREVQVIKDQLMACLQSESDLQLRDIVVMAPDIQLYVPFINAVFADIPHAIADRSLKISNRMLNILLEFLNLAQSRLGWRSVLDVLNHDLVASHFGLSQADLELIRFWILDTQVCWGQSAQHKKDLDLPPVQQNTWQACLDRLLMGFAVGLDDAFVDGVLPYPHIEGTASQALGGLNDFLQLLFKAVDDFKRAKSIALWSISLTEYADNLLGSVDPIEAEAFNELLVEMQNIALVHQQPIHFSVLLAWLEGRIKETKSTNGFLRGQLTFCSMLPMRSIPFQVIALLGMNEGEYPKVEQRPSFDLLSVQPKLGDRARRADDRYQFLEILLAARRKLIITYIGLSLQDNSDILPSVIISELLDVLQEHYALNSIVKRHPLHAFSARYFCADQSEFFSYEKDQFAIALQLCKPKADIQPWWQGHIEIEKPNTIVMDELFAFYKHPQRFFMRKQLGLSLPKLVLDAEEREPFQLDRLTLYLVQQLWVENRLSAKSFDITHLQALGLWPASSLGLSLWNSQKPDIELFIEQIQAKQLGSPRATIQFDQTIAEYRLIGKLENIFQQGMLIYRFTAMKGKDFVTAWIKHLILNQLEPNTTYLICKDREIVFSPEQANNTILSDLIDIFISGKQSPDAFYTEAAFHYLQQNKPETALDEVIKFMKIEIANHSEPEISRFLEQRDLRTVFNEHFAGICTNLLAPAWQVLQ